TAIEADDTGGSLHDRLAAMGAQAIVQALAQLAAGEARAQPQDNAQATYAHKLSKEEAQIDWARPAAEISRTIRAFNPWPVASSTLDGEPVRIWSAVPLPLAATGFAPGTVT